MRILRWCLVLPAFLISGAIAFVVAFGLDRMIAGGAWEPGPLHIVSSTAAGMITTCTAIAAAAAMAPARKPVVLLVGAAFFLALNILDLRLAVHNLETLGTVGKGQHMFAEDGSRLHRRRHWFRSVRLVSRKAHGSFDKKSGGAVSLC